MKKTTLLALLALQAVPVPVAEPAPAPVGEMKEEWDRDQTRALRDTVYPLLARMPDGAAIRAAFDKALLGDVSAVPDLITLMAHANDDVSRSAAKLLGRLADPRASAALKQTLAQDSRVRMQGIALASLGRMRDPEAPTLAIAALSNPDDYMKAAGGTALGLIGDSRNAPAILSYLDSMAARGALDTGAFDILAELGDPPGSTAVRDRLLAETNKKTNDFDERLDAAVALKKMGLAHLAIRILDWEKAQVTDGRLIVLRGLVERLAIERGIVLGDQSRLDAVLSQVDDTKYRSDAWGRPLRAKFVSAGSFHVIADGPDEAPDTVDDMSTAETFKAYERRVFADLF